MSDKIVLCRECHLQGISKAIIQLSREMEAERYDKQLFALIKQYKAEVRASLVIVSLQEFIK